MVSVSGSRRTALVFIFLIGVCLLSVGQSASSPATPSPAQPAGQQSSTPDVHSQPGTTPVQPAPPDQPQSAQPPQSVPQGDAAPPSDSQQPSQLAPADASNDPGMFVFKKQVEEVVLHATVVDERRHLVPYLDRNAFTVLEDGVPQTITSFRREDVPVAIGIVVDNSGSMRDKREKVSQAVLNLIRASNPQDESFVVNFSQNYYLDQDFTSDLSLLQHALQHLSTQGSTALYDAIVASSVHLMSNSKFSKKILLVITDGQDNMSQETLQEAARRLQQNNGPTLYAIGLTGGDLRAPGREALQTLANGTGGVAFFPDTLDGVDQITRTVAHDIRSQYTLAYKPRNQNAKPSYQSIRVEARAPGYGRLSVRSKAGYYNGDAAQ